MVIEKETSQITPPAQLLGGITRSRISFFDETPVGRILNRFAKDMDQVRVRESSGFL